MSTCGVRRVHCCECYQAAHHIYTCIYIYMYNYVYVYVYVYSYFVLALIFILVCVCTYICIQVYIYIHVPFVVLFGLYPGLPGRLAPGLRLPGRRRRRCPGAQGLDGALHRQGTESKVPIGVALKEV